MRQALSVLWSAGLWIYAAAAGGLVVLFSGSDYEWMVGEKEEDGGRKLTLCDIPVSSDDARDVYLPLTLVLVLLPLAGGAVSSIRARRVRPALGLGAALLAVWLYRFFLRKLGC